MDHVTLYSSVPGCTRYDVYWFWVFDDVLEALRLQRRRIEFSNCCNYSTMGHFMPRVLANGERKSAY